MFVSYRCLPNLRALLKPEVYRIRTNVWFSVCAKIERLQRDLSDVDALDALESLLPLLIASVHDEQLVDVNMSPRFEVENLKQKQVQNYNDPPEDQFTRRCDLCHADIWNRAFTCTKCLSEGKEFDMVIARSSCSADRASVVNARRWVATASTD
jgi:hypothetical protein